MPLFYALCHVVEKRRALKLAQRAGAGQGPGEEEKTPRLTPQKILQQHQQHHQQLSEHDPTTLGDSSSYAKKPVYPRTVAMLMLSRILESYEHKMTGSFGALKEMLENIEQAQSVWHMQLDHQRNRVLRLNLLISIFSLSGLCITIPAAFFGMNLLNGMESMPGLFWPVVQYSMLFGGTTAGGFYFYFRFGPRMKYQARMRDMRSLR